MSSQRRRSSVSNTLSSSQRRNSSSASPQQPIVLAGAIPQQRRSNANEQHDHQASPNHQIDATSGMGYGSSRDAPFDTFGKISNNSNVVSTASGSPLTALMNTAHRNSTAMALNTPSSRRKSSVVANNLTSTANSILNASTSGGAGATVDYMTFAEAPAYFDLPIALFLNQPKPTKPHNNKNNNNNNNNNNNGLSSTNSGNFDQQQPQSISDDMFGNMQDLNALNQQRQRRAQMITNKYLEPLTEFNTGEHLSNLEATVLNSGSGGVSNYYDTAIDNNSTRSGGRRGKLTSTTKNSSSSNTASKGRRGNNNSNKNITGNGAAIPLHLLRTSYNSSSSSSGATQKMLLPKSIGDIVNSLRPTHYAPLRKAIRNRSQERFYEGDTKEPEPDEETKRKQQLEEVAKMQQIESHVVTWQDEKKIIGLSSATLLNVPGSEYNNNNNIHPSSRGRTPDGGVSKHSFGNFGVGVAVGVGGEPLPHRPVSNNANLLTSRGGGGGRNSPLQAVHAGRRASMATAPMVGDLGAPSRSFHTHGNAHLPNNEMNPTFHHVIGGRTFTHLNDDDEDIIYDTTNTIYEPTHLLGSSPQRRAAQQQQQNSSSNYSTGGATHLLGVPTTGNQQQQQQQQRKSVTVSAEEQCKDSKKMDEFHRDLLAWYRTEATMLRVAM